MICPALAPRSNDDFIYWKELPERFRPMGAPILWGAPYQVGAMLRGSVHPLDFRLAVVNGAPSAEPDQWDAWPGEDHDPSLVGHLGLTVKPQLRLGVSYTIGPYSHPDILATLPEGRTIDDYDQEMWGLEATYTRGWTELRGELFLDRWEVPNVHEDPEDLSYYLELKQKLAAGLYAAVRYGAIRFSRIAEEEGEREQWDWDVERLQIATGFRVSRALELRGEYMLNRTRGPDDPDDNLFAVQLRWEF